MEAYFRCIHQRWVLILNAPAPHTRMWIGSARKWKAKMAEKGVQPTFLCKLAVADRAVERLLARVDAGMDLKLALR